MRELKDQRVIGVGQCQQPSELTLLCFGVLISAERIRDCLSSDADPDPPGSTSPIGQLYGTFKQPSGTRPIARFEMQWRMTICRPTATHPCL